MTLRSAQASDCRNVWLWRNERVARGASFKTGEIPYEDHRCWYAGKLADPRARLFIVLDDQGRDIGSVRFDLEEEHAEISVTIDKGKRGKGLGVAAIRAGSDYVLGTESIERIIAYVKSDNPVSKTVFERAGFSLMGSKLLDGVDAWELIYEAMARVPRGSAQGHRLSGEAP